MKKRLFATLCLTAMLLALAACGSASGPKETTAPLQTEPPAPTAPAIATADENGNYIFNGGFELTDFTGWTLTNEFTEELDIYTRTTDCYEGVQSLHFYSGANVVDFTAEQKLNGLEAGSYKLTAYVQGDTAGDADSTVYFYITVNGETRKVDTMLSGYVAWNCAELSGIVIPEGAEVTVGVCVKNAPGGWGTIDAITLVKE